MCKVVENMIYAPIYISGMEVQIKKGDKKGETKNIKASFLFLTDLYVNEKNVAALTEAGRRRWKILLINVFAALLLLHYRKIIPV